MLRTILLYTCFAVLLVVVAVWQGYIEFYRRVPNAQVTVNGVPAGYLHLGPHSMIVTRTDLSPRHSYRTWDTGIEVIIFDCQRWVAPNWSLFTQGHISGPCTFFNSESVTTPASPSRRGVGRTNPLEFVTRDAAVVRVYLPPAIAFEPAVRPVPQGKGPSGK